MNKKIIKLTNMSVLCALSIVAVIFIRFPIFPAASFLIYDPADIPLLIGTFMFGPVAGLLMAAVTSGIQALFLSADGIIGFIMHMLSTGTLLMVSGLIYRKKHTRKGALAGLIFGSLAMVIIMIPANLVITTNFYGVPFDAVVALLPVIIAFNLIKAVANSAVVFLIYKPLSRIMNKY